MDNQKLILLFQELQYGVVFNGYISNGFAKICYSNDDTSIYWNYAFTNQLLTVNQLKELESEFKNLNRTATIYFEKSETTKDLVRVLEENNYEKKYEEAWLFHEDPIDELDQFKQIKKVLNEEDLAVFLKTFDSCYQKDDPQNPYGELSGYLDSAKKAWTDTNDEKLEYFIAYKGNEPVAVAALTSYEGLGYIANVGSLQKVRGEGFGKLITQYCVWKSKQNGNEYHFLATEDGTYPYNFYHRIGFKSKFITLGFTKKDV